MITCGVSDSNVSWRTSRDSWVNWGFVTYESISTIFHFWMKVNITKHKPRSWLQLDRIAVHNSDLSGIPWFSGCLCSFRPSFASLLWKTYPATTRTTSLTLKAMRERKRCSQSMEDRVEYGMRKYWNCASHYEPIYEYLPHLWIVKKLI